MVRRVSRERERERDGQNNKRERERLLGLGEAGMWMSGGHTKLYQLKPFEIIDLPDTKHKPKKEEVLKTWNRVSQLKEKKIGKRPEVYQRALRVFCLCLGEKKKLSFSLAKIEALRMPRPGPRPYECVRRAWHSDRHQPIRGSLIKEIFRVANEIHSSATKKNKEWQEKLPIVVLKAEEIMYSKANSEVEYMDLKTLWDRTNDAINTIIRLDESTETGEFLQPCIEAALNLGCTPRRASRSQRNSNPRCYLSTNTSEVPSVSPNMVENVAHGDYRINSLYMSHGSSFVKPTTMNPTHLSSGTGIPVVENSDCSGIKSTCASENVPPKYDQLVATENYAVSNSFPAYPLYYGNCHQFGKLQLGFGVLPKSFSNPLEPAERGIVTNLFHDKDATKKKNAQTNVTDGRENPCSTGCDLSLRLGPFSLPPCPDVGNNRPLDVKDGGFQEGIKFSHQSSELDKDFPSFPRANAYVPLGFCSSRWNLEGGYMKVEEKTRKRKAGLDHPMEDQQFCLQPKLRFSHLTGSMRNAGL